MFGHVHWLHAVHGRFCYIPIVIAAAWFGLRGGLYTATVISILIFPYVLGTTGDIHDFAAEIADILFYYAIAILVGILVDRENAALRLREEAQRQVEQSQKLSLVGQLAAGVAHEIKNPLTSIKGAADILMAEDTSLGEREEFKEILNTEIRRIDATVAEFLEFARPKEIELHRLDLAESLRPAVRQVQALAAKRDISVEAVLETGVYVNGDAEKLHQMTFNLLLNGVQASCEGSKVHVSIETANGHARVITSDWGMGMTESDLRRIFEPFFTTKPSGTGLGLAVVRAIVEAHGGDVFVKSRKGEGTTVEVRLPIQNG
jgi:signal transduction histidine kinase